MSRQPVAVGDPTARLMRPCSAGAGVGVVGGRGFRAGKCFLGIPLKCN